MRRQFERIAIVGIGGLFPGSADLDRFWSNVRSAKDMSSDPPPGRWAIEPHQVLDNRGIFPDRVPTLRGYYLQPFAADLDGVNLNGWPIAELDPVFHLALHIGNAAWRSAVTAPIDRERCGVILGNIALPIEKANALTLEMFGPKLGLFHPKSQTNPLNRHSTGLPAALLARGLGFGLGGFALDAACASSLYALKLACDELQSGRADAMIAGGLVRPDSLYTQMGFAQLRALSPTGRCSPFDAQANGLVVGEGGCAFVLKRLSDAYAHGDSIHGVIAGIGLSNDVEGNVLQPASEGQLRALHAAYKQAGWRPSDVQLIECHATGTPTGDAVEFDSLRKLWKDEPGRAVIGGVKSTVGHLLTGAGAASLAKVLLAMKNRTLPPTANFDKPSATLGYEGGPFRILKAAESWESIGPLRAAINGFGFGGINAHVLIEEPTELVNRATVVQVLEMPRASIAVVRLASRTGTPIESLTIPITRFRIPPTELAEMLPQQTLMLQIAAEAMDSCSPPLPPQSGERERLGVFIGVSLDTNTTNYFLRWKAGEIDQSLKDQVHPALTANRTMGSLASIAASRVARFLGAGGPSFAVCDEEAGGLRAVSLAVEALQKHEIDRALAGAVEFATDPRYGGSQDGAGAVVLKRLDDAKRDGDRILAVIDGVQSVQVANVQRPTCGAASGILEFIDRCRDLDQERTTINGRPAFWIHDRANGPRRATVQACNLGRFGVRVSLTEWEQATSPVPIPAGLEARRHGLFPFSGDSVEEILNQLSKFSSQTGVTPDELASRLWQLRAGSSAKRFQLAFVAADRLQLQQRIAQAQDHLQRRPHESIADGIYFSPKPLGGEIAFVYPGSGNHFAGMGRELGVAFPHVLHRQMAENQHLRSQYHADEIWGTASLDQLLPRELIFAQVALGTLVSDLLTSFNVRAHAVVPYSLGESAGLYGTRAWQDRDEMFRRMKESSLFATDLTGPCNAARRKWKLPTDRPVDWLTGVISASPERVLQAISESGRVYLQIVNTPEDCVIGGERVAVEAVVRKLGASFIEVRGVSTAHCEVAEPVQDAYRELHLLPTFHPEGIRYYSGAWGRAYSLNRESAADAIMAAAMDTIDFPAVVNAAYADGVRLFVEVGPGSSCSRMIGSILAGKPHLAIAACVPRKDDVAVVLNVLANLFAEGVPVDLSKLVPRQSDSKPARTEATSTLPVGYQPKQINVAVACRSDFQPERDVCAQVGNLNYEDTTHMISPVVILTDTQTATLHAHEEFLRFSTSLQQHFGQVIAQQTQMMSQGALPLPIPERTVPTEIPRALDFEACMEFARGLVGNVLGPRFADIDSFPTRVRLPDGPLQLVDRIVTIEGEPLSMTSGSLMTEHRVRDDRWYLDLGRIPACIAIEAGQADLFLSSYLGIDFKTRGLACYRLLDAAVTFHRDLPTVGELIRYDIRIDHFFRQGNTYLFRFNFEGSVNGKPLLTMRDGSAGFFTAEELAAGKGVIHTALDLKPIPGKQPADWAPFVPLRDESLSNARVDALRAGDLVAAFGPEFSRARLSNPMRLPGGMLKLVDRVERIEPTGGRYGLGRIRCEADIHPDDWFLTCHFVDDQVMPGTLMYECCLHSLRVLLMRMGWVCEEGEATFEPVPGVASKLKCRGQVIATTKKVTYEISVKEIGFRPEPFVICDALMYADGKPIVDIANLSLRLRGLTRERLNEIWGPEFDGTRSVPTTLVFSREQVLEFATGSPSNAFGDRYRPFDRDRFIARLPAPPYSFIDRVTRIANCEQWKLAPGGEAEVEYAVPRDAWYFASNRCETMPYCVLNEIALQACGWMAAYLGSALTSPHAMRFRNLGGNAIQHAAITPVSGLLTTKIKLTKVSPAAGMIILQFDFVTRDANGPVYSGDTTFGFFTLESLANQVGMKDASFLDLSGASPDRMPTEAPFPDAILRMIDTISWNTITGGPKGLGAIEGRARVNPEAWFFKAHFFQDPVWPGSLGLESIVQLLKAHAHSRWGEPQTEWQAMVPGERHRWAYRGQIVPGASEVTVQAYITQVDDAGRVIKADGLLGVDGRIIYQVSDFTVQG